MDWTWVQLERKCDPDYTEFVKFNVSFLAHCWNFAGLLILIHLNDFKTFFVYFCKQVCWIAKPLP